MPGWSLLLFSLTIQACVGALVWVEIVQLSVASRPGLALPDPLRFTMMRGITVAIVAAVSISLMHLGSPIRVVFAMNNLGTSWLSREVLLVTLFGSGVALATVMQWRGWGSELSRSIVSRVTAILGLALVYVMARLHMLPTTPGWNTAVTPISFYATSLVFGGVVVLASLLHTKLASSANSSGRVILVPALVICLGVEIVLIPFQASIQFGHPMVGYVDGIVMLSILVGLRVLCVAAALGFLISFLQGSPQRSKRWVLAAVVLVLIAEILGRYTFYASYYRIGV